MRTNKKVLAIVAVIALVAILGVCLIACNADSYTKKLEKAGYKASAVKAEEVEKYGIKSEDVDWVVSAAKTTLDFVFVIKFKKDGKAKDTQNDLKGTPLITVDRSGAVLFIGSEAGVKAAK